MLLVDARGVPLSIIVTGANRHDVTQLATTLDSIVVGRPEVRPYHPQNLCADAGFTGKPAHEQIVERDIARTCARAAKKRYAKRTATSLGAGLWRLRILGSTVSESSWFAMKRRIVHTWH